MSPGSLPEFEPLPVRRPFETDEPPRTTTDVVVLLHEIDAWARDAGKVKQQASRQEIGREFYREVEEQGLVPLTDAMRLGDKLDNEGRVDDLLGQLVASIPERQVERGVEAKAIFKELKERVLRDEILKHGTRLDGRSFDEIRPITIAYLRTHAEHMERCVGVHDGGARPACSLVLVAV